MACRAAVVPVSFAAVVPVSFVAVVPVSFVAVAALALLAACTAKLDGPAPALSLVAPSVVCGEQHVTTVTLTGAGLAPLVVDSATGDPLLAVPDVILEQTADLDGMPVAATSVTLQNDPRDPAAARVRWHSATEMAFDLYPELGLAPGAYSVTVVNRNGKSTNAGVLTVVARPVVTAVEPDLVCLAQGARQLVLRGSGFLDLNGTLPRVKLGDLELPVDALGDCRAIFNFDLTPICASATVTVPEGALDSAASPYAVVLTNPAPAECHSEETVTFAVTPPPVLDTVVPDLACGAQGERTFTLSGAGFLVVDGALPAVTLGPYTAPAAAADDCTPVAGSLLTVESCTTLTFAVPEATLDPGAHVVTVTNPDPAGCVSDSSVTVAIVPAPVLDAAVPDLLCLADGARELVLEGSGFLTVDGALPVVTIADVTFTPDFASGCSAVEGTLLDAFACDSLTLTVPLGALATGVHLVTVENPAPAGCASAELVTVAIVPAPVLTAVAPALACGAQGERTFTLSGADFLVVDGALPSVTLGTFTAPAASASDCTPVAGTVLLVESCATLTFAVPASTIDPGAHTVTVANPAPAGCVSVASVTVVIVSPPVLDAAVTDLLCLADGDRALVLEGSGFLTVAGVLPVVMIGGTSFTPDSASGCSAVTGTLLDVLACDSLALTVPAGALTSGEHAVTVANPGPAGCVSAELVTLAIVSPPVLDAVVPDLVCVADGDRALLLTGSGFLTVAGALPLVTIGGAPVVAASASGCVPVAGSTLGAELCDAIAVTVPVGALATGVHLVTVENPAPAGCASAELVTVAVLPEPSLAGVNPGLLCTSGGAVSMELTGAFVRDGSELPTVHVGALAAIADSAAGCVPMAGLPGEVELCSSIIVTLTPGLLGAGLHEVSVADPTGCSSPDIITVLVLGAPVVTALVPDAFCSTLPPASINVLGAGFLKLPGGEPTVTLDGVATALLALAGCVPVPDTIPGAEVCTSLTIELPGGGITAGDHLVTVLNPTASGCSGTGSAVLEVVPIPVVTAVIPLRVCGLEGDSFVIDGADFRFDALVTVTPVGGGAALAVAATWVDATRFDVVLAPDELPLGGYDVTVSNGAGCAATLPASLEVVDDPVVFFVDPARVYNGIAIQLTVYVSGISDTVTSVAIRPTGTLALPVVLPHEFDPFRANRIAVTLPEGTAPGDYDVILNDAACETELVSGLHVVDTLGVEVTSMNLPFGATGVNTPVLIRSIAPPPGFVGFAATPRAYLNPVSGFGLARELRAVAFYDPTRLTAVVPRGLPTGPYDLIVVNPDGGVGLLPSAFTVLESPPPEITGLVPGLVENRPGQLVTVTGRAFATPMIVSAICRAPGGALTVVTAVSGATTAATIAATFDMSVLGGGNVCVVRATNVEGSYGEFSALTVTNPSNNLNDFLPGPNMVVARRAAGGAAVRMNSVSRYLFAIGGDGGAGTPAHASVDSAPVDPFGDVGFWSLQTNQLPVARSFTAATVVGRFVYLAGGAAGAPSTSVLRAFLLDPFQAPEVVDLGIASGFGAGLVGGIWYYRVAAVMDAADPTNPDGEGLPSEPLVVQLPDVVDRLHLTIHFSPVPGAASYRVYRSPVVGGIAGDERLLAELPAVPAPSFTDDGSLAVDPTRRVMPLGSLGTWHEVGTLATAREGAALVAVPDGNVPERWYLHLLGGRGPGGTALRSTEWATVEVLAEDDQVVGPFALGTMVLPTARWQLGAVYIDSLRAAAVPAGDAWIYALPGLSSSGGASVNEIAAFRIDTAEGADFDDGRLYPPVLVNAPNIGGGYGYVAGNEYLYLLGASGGAPSAGGKSAKICAIGEAGCGGGAAVPPELLNWNAGIALARARYLHASASESGFIFLLGGQTSTEAASASTERTTF